MPAVSLFGRERDLAIITHASSTSRVGCVVLGVGLPLKTVQKLQLVPIELQPIC